MRDRAILCKDVTVRFKPYLDRAPTLRKTLARRRHRAPEPVVALDEVSFEVHQGEAFGVVGPNGAGKSTLLRVMAGTLVPDEGVVEVQGKVSTLLQLGLGFNPELTGRRNVYLGGLSAGLQKREIDERFDEIVSYADLWGAVERPLKTYSSGMFARLAFSVAMHLDPDILLLDEVLAVGDEAFKDKSMEAMKAVLDRAGTIVFVSHSLASVVDFCDRALWLEGGEIRAMGEAGEVVEDYKEAVRARRG